MQNPVLMRHLPKDPLAHLPSEMRGTQLAILAAPDQQDSRDASREISGRVLRVISPKILSTVLL